MLQQLKNYIFMMMMTTTAVLLMVMIINIILKLNSVKCQMPKNRS